MQIRLIMAFTPDEANTLHVRIWDDAVWYDLSSPYQVAPLPQLMDFADTRLSAHCATDYQCLAGATKGGAAVADSLKDIILGESVRLRGDQRLRQIARQ